MGRFSVRKLVELMLTFYPDIFIDFPWDNLTATVKDVAKNFVHTQEFKKHMLYKHGASEVAELPTGGWISKQAFSHDFFVMGGIPETMLIESKFKEMFPNFEFTPGTICYSTQSVPMHIDSVKNGLCSLIYPLHDHTSISKVYGKDGTVEEYKFLKGHPVILDITEQHEVINSGERIWFSIHFHSPIDQVQKAFNNIGQVVIK